jgi:hypothetical protein
VHRKGWKGSSDKHSFLGHPGGNAVCSEIQKTWSRDDAARWAEAYAAVFPHYQLLIESYSKAQEVTTKHEALDSQRKELRRSRRRGKTRLRGSIFFGGPVGDP